MRKLLVALGIMFAVFVSWSFIAHTAHAAEDNADFIVQTIPGPTVAEKLVDRTETSWPWYLTRASGIMAAIILVVLMLSGIGQITGYTFKFLDPLTSWASHRALGIALGVSVLLHILSLLFDHFVKFSLLDILIPWLSDYKPVKLFGIQFGSMYVAFGILAFYLMVIIILTSLVWVEKKPYIWKWIHLLSYITIFFVFIHALYIGTDLTHGILRWVWIFLGASIFVASMKRLWRARTA